MFEYKINKENKTYPKNKILHDFTRNSSYKIYPKNKTFHKIKTLHDFSVCSYYKIYSENKAIPKINPFSFSKTVILEVRALTKLRILKSSFWGKLPCLQMKIDSSKGKKKLGKLDLETWINKKRKMHPSFFFMFQFYE